MAIVSECTQPGCETLTMGPYCIEHEVPVERRTRAPLGSRVFRSPLDAGSHGSATLPAVTLRRASEQRAAALHRPRR